MEKRYKLRNADLASDRQIALKYLKTKGLGKSAQATVHFASQAATAAGRDEIRGFLNRVFHNSCGFLSLCFPAFEPAPTTQLIHTGQGRAPGSLLVKSPRLKLTNTQERYLAS